MDDDGKVPCCQLDAARKVKRLYIKGIPVGISKLDHIIDYVSSLGLENEDEIKKELITQMKLYNYIPAEAEKDYGEAAFQFYKNCSNNEE